MEKIDIPTNLNEASSSSSKTANSLDFYSKVLNVFAFLILFVFIISSFLVYTVIQKITIVKDFSLTITLMIIFFGFILFLSLRFKSHLIKGAKELVQNTNIMARTSLYNGTLINTKIQKIEKYMFENIKH